MTVMDFPSSPVNGQTTTDGRYYFDSSVGSSGAWRSAPLPVGGLPAGSIMAWGTNTPPANWLLADGSAVSRSVYSSLFAVIGTTYGAGDGSTTFALPDLRGRVPVGKNGGTFGTLGATGGAETHTLTEAQMPSHNHWIANNDASGPYTFPAYSAMTGFTSSGTSTHNTLGTLPRGDGQAHNNLQPYLVVNYIIKASAGWTAGDSELATRLGAVETANAGANKAGLVPIVPTSVSVGGGSASVNSAGIVTVTSAYDIKLNGVFSSTYKNYLVLVNYNSCTSTPSIYMKLTTAGTVNSTGYVYSTWRVNASGAGYYMGSTNSTGGVYITEADASQGSGSSRSQVTIFNPFESTYSVINAHGHGGYAAQGWNMILTSGIHDTSSRDGFQLTHGTTQATGTVQVYGYR